MNILKKLIKNLVHYVNAIQDILHILIKKKEFDEFTNKQINDNDIIELNDLKTDFRKIYQIWIKKIK